MGKTIAVIPARYGSKRVPRKNVKLLCGQPLIKYSIDHAKELDCLDKIIVTTDDSEAAKIALGEGCEVVHRPSRISGDRAKTTDAIKHVLNTLRLEKYSPDYILLLQPTVPIREMKVIFEALFLLEKEKCDSVVSHVRVDFGHPNRLKCLQGTKVTPYADPEIEGIQRSELPLVYRRNGAVYAFRANLVLEQNSVMGKNQHAVIADDQYSVNIDSYKDWLLAEAMVKFYGSHIIRD